MKYLANILIKCQLTGQFSQGVYSNSFDDLDSLRAWAKSVGKPGDLLRIMKNGTSFAETGRELVI